jgi:hypothetical protein
MVGWSERKKMVKGSTEMETTFELVRAMEKVKGSDYERMEPHEKEFPEREKKWVMKLAPGRQE